MIDDNYKMLLFDLGGVIIDIDPSITEKELKWKRKVLFQDLVSGMVQYDLHNDNYGGLET